MLSIVFHLCKQRNIHSLPKKAKMEEIKNLLNPVNSQGTMTVNRSARAKCNQEVVMSYNEVNYQMEEKYYNKASGCSVKAQKDNLFDYRSWRNTIR